MRSVALTFLGKGHFVPQLLGVLVLFAGTFPRQSPAEAQEVSRPSSPVASARGPSRVVLEEQTLRPSETPLANLSPKEIQALVATNLSSLGPISVGRPNRGTLINPVALEGADGIEVMNRERNFGTRVTVDSLIAAVAEVRARFPNTPALRVGDISRSQGGYIRPHRSHQNGLDVDLGYYYSSDVRWYTKANAANLDRERTWALVKALIAQGTVEYLFMDRSIQALLREHALARGEAPEWIDAIFQKAPRTEAVIRHTWGHLTHFHVRFSDPTAANTARRLSPYSKSLALAHAKTYVKAPKRRVQPKAKRR